jgi:hypothetical protein
MDIWKRDLIKEIIIKRQTLNQLKKLLYDIDYQNGHALSLKSLNQMPNSLGFSNKETR